MVQRVIGDQELERAIRSVPHSSASGTDVASVNVVCAGEGR